MRVGHGLTHTHLPGGGMEGGAMTIRRATNSQLEGIGPVGNILLDSQQQLLRIP